MRKYKLASSASCSLWPLRRLITTRRPRRTFSEVELIFKESTNVAAALVRAGGMSRSAKFATGRTSPGGSAPFSRIAIVSLVFDLISLDDRMEWNV